MLRDRLTAECGGLGRRHFDQGWRISLFLSSSLLSPIHPTPSPFCFFSSTSRSFPPSSPRSPVCPSRWPPSSPCNPPSSLPLCLLTLSFYVLLRPCSGRAPYRPLRAPRQEVAVLHKQTGRPSSTLPGEWKQHATLEAFSRGSRGGGGEGGGGRRRRRRKERSLAQPD